MFDGSVRFSRYSARKISPIQIKDSHRSYPEIIRNPGFSLSFATLKYIFLYFIFFLGHGTYFSTLSPFIVDHYGASSGYVFLAGQLAFPLGTLLTGYLSDRTHRIRILLVASFFLHAPLQYLLYSITDHLGLSILLGGANRFFFAVNLQLASIAVLEAKGTPGFGRVRAWGTGGFFFIHMLLFLIEGSYWKLDLFPDGLDAGLAGKLGSVFHIVSGFLAFLVQSKRHSKNSFDMKGVFQILGQRPTILFFSVSFLFFFSFQVVDYYLGSFLKGQGGMDTVYLGWAIAVILEIPFLFLSGRWTDAFGARSLFILSIGSGILRFAWISLSIAGVLDVPILGSQILHGLHFTGYYIGAIYFLRRSCPDHLYGTAYGAYVILSNSLGGGMGSLVASQILTLKIPGADGEILDPYLIMFSGAAFIHILIFFSFLFPWTAASWNRKDQF